MDKQLAQLESVLTQQASAHRQLLVMLQRKRQLLRTADHNQITALSGQENQVVQRIGELEKQRLGLVGQLTVAVDPKAPQPMRLGELAQRLEEPLRGRLLVLRQQLNENIQQVGRETAVAKRATEALVRHIQGLIQTVGGVITGVGVYSREGSLPKETITIRTFNATA